MRDLQSGDQKCLVGFLSENRIMYRCECQIALYRSLSITPPKCRRYHGNAVLCIIKGDPICESLIRQLQCYLLENGPTCLSVCAFVAKTQCHAPEKRFDHPTNSMQCHAEDARNYARSCLRLKFRVRFMSFLYLCFFIFSFRCLLTEMSNILYFFAALGAFLTDCLASVCSMIFCFNALQYCCSRCRFPCWNLGRCGSGTATTGDEEAVHVLSPFAPVDSVRNMVVRYFFSVFFFDARFFSAAFCSGSKGCGAGGAAYGLKEATTSSRLFNRGGPSRCVTPSWFSVISSTRMPSSRAAPAPVERP